MNVVRPSPQTYRRLVERIGRAPGLISNAHASGPVKSGAHSAPKDAPDLDFPVETGRGHVPRPLFDIAFDDRATPRERAYLRCVFSLFWLAGVVTGLWIALGATWLARIADWVI